MAGSPFNRPLLATEHSEYDVGAERLGMAIARHCDLPLAVVMPIVSNPEYEATTPQAASRADAAVAACRSAFAEEARAHGVSVDVQTRHGMQLWREIIEQARDVGADLLVTRRRGHPGLLANLLLGDMVHKVLSHAPCDMLICPRAAQMWSRRVLVAIDPAAPDARVLHRAHQVAATCEVPLTVLGVVASDDPAQHSAATQALRAVARTLPDVDTEVIVRAGVVQRQIFDAARASGADLIVVGRHGGEGLARAFIGGVAQKVIGLAECPVLVIPPAPKESPTS